MTMNKPNNHKDTPRVMFGALKDRCDKVIIGGKSTVSGGYEIRVLQADGNYQVGKVNTLNPDDVTGEYVILDFCKRSSLKAMIAALQELDDAWQKEADRKIEESLGKDDVLTDAVKNLCRHMTPQAQEALLSGNLLHDLKGVK